MDRDDANLDLLRTVAVLLVVTFHLLLALGAPERIWPLGGWGVYMFFVHTSLVLMYSLRRQVGDAAITGGQLRDFLARRAFRILPLSVLVVSVVCVLSLPVGHLRGGHFVPVPMNAAAVAANLLLVQNLTGHESVMATLWSLPYELQMYLVLPALYLLARRPRALRLLLPLWLLACVAGRWLPLGTWQMPLYVPCFLAGVVAYRLSLHRRPRLPAAAFPLLVLGLTAAYYARPSRGLEWVYTLLLAAALPLFKPLQWPPLRRACQLVARYSYGIYLSHFLCLWLAFERVARATPAFRMSVFVTSAAAAPFALYHVIESPFINLGRRWTVPAAAWPDAAKIAVTGPAGSGSSKIDAPTASPADPG